MDKFASADVDCRVVDTIARVALEEQQIAFSEIVDGFNQRPTVVFGIGMRASAAHLDAGFGQTLVDETRTVE